MPGYVIDGRTFRYYANSFEPDSGLTVIPGLLRLRWFAVRVEAGDFAPVEPQRMMVEGLVEARDHRTVALVAFQALPAASHVFTVAEDAPAPVTVCWRRGQLAGALGELDGVAGGAS